MGSMGKSAFIIHHFQSCHRPPLLLPTASMNASTARDFAPSGRTVGGRCINTWPPGPRPSSFKTAFVAKGLPAGAESWFSGRNGCHCRSPRHATCCRCCSRSLPCQALPPQLLHRLKLISPTATAIAALMTTAAAARSLSRWGIKARPPLSVFLVMSAASCWIK